MRATQGAFSFIRDLTDEQICRQVAHALARRWAVSIEHTDDPHPSNACWEMWGAPMHRTSDPNLVMEEVKACRAAYPNRHVKLVAFDAARDCETVRLALFVHRPGVEPGYELVRRAAEGRRVRYAFRARRPAERSAS